MHLYDIIFKLSDREKLVIDLEMPFEALPCFCQTTILFHDGLKQYILNLYDDLESSIQRLRDILSKSLNDKMHLHKSLIDDLGYLHNECLKYGLNENDETWQLNPNLTYDEDEIWIGYHYQLWACGGFAAWMYNDEHGAIIFEITPRYPGFYVKEEEYIAIPSYEEWIQTYHFSYLKIVSTEVAKEWLNQADKILKYIKDKFDRNSLQDNDDQKMIYEECPRGK